MFDGDDVEYLRCPICDSDLCTLIGKLGAREHWRCCSCGMQFSRDVEDDYRSEEE